ncbi:FtsX-like permease family protein [Actinomadura kijaniata]|uniref:FtsX-like permease family protein n=1 Tax=Actinomadura kijaniata TaxID=46161 RepID=UPI000832CA8E|nr:FtsX-like permease family protein [Actinomadura kijaniata]
MRKPKGRGAAGSMWGVFAALLFAAVLVGSCGVLLESALRAHAPVERYGAASAVVTAPHRVQERIKPLGDAPEVQSRPLTEPGRVPVALAERLRGVPGVRAVVADVSFPVVSEAGRAMRGHGWESAALGPFPLRQGRAPRAPGEVTLDAASGARVGDAVRLQTTGAPRPFRVTGLVAGPPAAYFASATAEALGGRPGHADALAVLGDADADALRRAVPGLRVATGADRGDAENLAVAAARPDMIELSASLGGVAVMIALLVVGGLVALSVRERARELALLRAVGATPGQVRGRIVRQALTAAVPAGVVGGASSLAAGAGLHAVMASAHVLPDGYRLSLSVLPALAALLVTVLAAAVTSLLASLRVSRIRPAWALGEAELEPAALPRWRVVTGVVFLILGLNSLGLSFAVSGQAAAASVSGLVLTLVVATALLGPLIVQRGNRVLGRLARVLSPVPGRLAQHNAAAAALRAGSMLTPVALAVAFAGTQLFASSTVARATTAEAAAGNRADQVLVSTGPGLPPEAAAAVRAVPGVTAATAVARTTVVMTVRELGERRLRSLHGQGVTPGDAARILDPKVSRGRLGDLADGTVALSENVAGGVRLGSPVTLWLADGTRIRPRVVAFYERGLGFGDVLLPRSAVTAPLDDHVLVKGDADLRPVAARYPGARVAEPEALGVALARELRLQNLMSWVVVAAILGFVVIGLVTTLALATGARRREFGLLRDIGATRRQVLAMVRMEALVVLGTGLAVGTLIATVTLLAFAAGVTGLPLPAVSPAAALAILAFVAVSGTAAVMLPARRATAPGTGS